MTPDVTKFPQPNSWATWCGHRRPQFKTHRNLGMVKAAITNGISGGFRMGFTTWDWWVYRYINDEWIEYIHVPAGSTHGHELWTDPKHSAKVKPVSDKAVEKAIASIQRSST